MDNPQFIETAFSLASLEGLDVSERRHRSRLCRDGGFSLSPDDAPVPENEEFSYWILKPEGAPRSGRVIFLLHGLNERRWDKYLPWARRIALSSGAAVILFPLAYHMNRTPRAFCEMDEVFRVYRARKASQGSEGESSHANAML